MGYNWCGQLNNSEANIIATIHLNLFKTKIKTGENFLIKYFAIYCIRIMIFLNL
jgi:hypothetical protein